MAQKSYQPGDPKKSAAGAAVAAASKAPPKAGAVTFPKPPPPPAQAGNKEQRFYDWAKKNHVAPDVAANLWFWSGQYGAGIGGQENFAYFWTAVLLRESNAQHLDPKTGKVKNSGQAVGIGQLNPSVWVNKLIPWRKDGKRFTNDNNPDTGILVYGNNLRASAFYLAQGIQQKGFSKGAYTQYYNPSDPNRFAAWDDINATLNTRPSDVVLAPTTGPGPPTPNPGDNTVPPFKDPFITGLKKGGIFAFTDDPNKAMQFDGRPLTRSSFLSLKDQLTSIYVSYTGGRPTNAQIQQFIIKGWDSQYTLPAILSQGAKFDKSPIYKQFVTNWMSDPQIKDALAGGKLPPALILQGVINHWDPATILTKVRALPQYIKSNEFKGNVATFLNVHSAIMGTPDKKAMLAIQDAALQGWKPDQYAAWLRSQPEYTGSPEYQTKALTILQGLGLITGQNAILARGVGPGPGAVQPGTQTLKPDPRIKGNPNNQNPTAVSDLGATLGRA